MDGTIANIEIRVQYALDAAGGVRNDAFWTALFQNPMVVTDRPICTARRVLSRLAEQGLMIVYLTNRPVTMQASTCDWLRLHSFPAGEVLLRPDGMSGHLFKAQAVAEASTRQSVLCGIGDQESDLEAYRSASIPGLLVERNSEADWVRIEREVAALLIDGPGCGPV